ncbi:hypothetical protein BJY01DRAFT_228767 [Aspergillus pseudoustus]|uniref:Uncharacterized protein n=1 Tax=Aspergillus pseudoustus TaxID=1810923 RepID=A0ABR4IJF5_9EURO
MTSFTQAFCATGTSLAVPTCLTRRYPCPPRVSPRPRPRRLRRRIADRIPDASHAARGIGHATMIGKLVQPYLCGVHMYPAWPSLDARAKKNSTSFQVFRIPHALSSPTTDWLYLFEQSRASVVISARPPSPYVPLPCSS